MARGRFAPSPTGPIHLGTARTALVAWLRARASGSSFVMRVEDLDAPRVREGAMEAMLADLRWLGLDWDEGPDVDGPHAPYLQSERLGIYERAFVALKERAHLFPCTCSRKEIAEVASAPHGEEPLYPGTCRLAPSHPERAPAWRFRLDAPPAFDDLVHGRVEGRGGGDFVVRRADGVFAYQLAVAVDDAAMQIEEVVRGDDLLTSTPRQLALFAALGERAPRFVHVPLVLGPDGERLAKRHGAIAVAAYRERGVRPESLVGLLAASLGLLEPAEPVTPRDLVERFDLARLPREPVRLDPSSLLPG